MHNRCAIFARTERTSNLIRLPVHSVRSKNSTVVVHFHRKSICRRGRIVHEPLHPVLYTLEPLYEQIHQMDIISLWSDPSTLLRTPGDLIYDEMHKRLCYFCSGRGWLDRQSSYRGRDGQVEPATVVKVKGSGRQWSRDNYARVA